MSQKPSDPRYDQIPSVDKIKQELKHERVPSRVLTYLIRETVEAARTAMGQSSEAPRLEDLLHRVRQRLARLKRGQFRHAINATGVVLHTNLGRAPVGKAWLEAAVNELAGYSVLELDDESPVRGSRTQTIEPLLNALCGSESAIVVNNNAAGVFLALFALAHGKSAIVSRGELVQIGGGFRVPEILAASGARLVEIGSTNITKPADYEKALAENPEAVLLKVHQSNFAMSGHVEQVSVGALAKLAVKFGRPLIVDWGSGSLWERVGDEPAVTDLLRDGASVLCFSGDKLLGGPQAGIVLGEKRYLTKLKQSPLYRAMRLSKFELFLLERCLLQFLDERPNETARLLSLPESTVRSRAERFQKQLAEHGVTTKLVTGNSAAGGGTTPGLELPTVLVECDANDDVVQALFAGTPCVMARREAGKLLFDLRTVFEHEEPSLLEAVVAVRGKDR